MKLYFADGYTREYLFGANIRGVREGGERPLNAYITPKELEKRTHLQQPLAQYLIELQMALQLDGRIVIK